MNKLIVGQDFCEVRRVWSLFNQVATENDQFLRISKVELFKNYFVVRKPQPKIAYRNIKIILQ